MLLSVMASSLNECPPARICVGDRLADARERGADPDRLLGDGKGDPAQDAEADAHEIGRKIDAARSNGAFCCGSGG
jgi:hypothetical protein